MNYTVKGCENFRTWLKVEERDISILGQQGSKNTGQMRTPHVKYSAVKKIVILEKNLG
jgi:hypothetical protein